MPMFSIFVLFFGKEGVIVLKPIRLSKMLPNGEFIKIIKGL